jgi:2-hydroxy-6-oxonona-2,4-dienedioate hydrolase
VPDLPGFGLSGNPGAALDTTRLADALGGWLHAAGTAPAVLLGNSYGCQVIVDLVARHPEVAAAVVLSGPTTDPHARTVTARCFAGCGTPRTRIRSRRRSCSARS